MDDRRFDDVARQLARGASRRSILKGLLGFGGAAAVGGAILSDSDARTTGSRPSIPTPKAPTQTPIPPTPTPLPTATADPCTGYHCGPDCCATQAQCCDGECCPGGFVCIGEEICCRADLVCPSAGNSCCVDGQACCAGDGCCEGTCYFDSAGAERCCPTAAAAVCGNDCCANITERCCTADDGTQSCIPIASECCTHADCSLLTDPSACLIGVCDPTNLTCGTVSTCTAGTQCCDVSGAGQCLVTCPTTTTTTAQPTTTTPGQTTTTSLPTTSTFPPTTTTLQPTTTSTTTTSTPPTTTTSVPCVPDCTGKTCGDNGCGGTCGVCNAFPRSFCNTTTNTCDCDPLTCPPGFCNLSSPDGCGGALVCSGCCEGGGICCEGVTDCGGLGYSIFCIRCENESCVLQPDLTACICRGECECQENCVCQGGHCVQG